MVENCERFSTTLQTKRTYSNFLQLNGISTSTDSEKANMLAKFFADQCSARNGRVCEITGAPYPLPEKHPTFSCPNIPDHNILRRLKRLAVHKASDNKLITNRLLRETAPFIAASLTHIFYLSLSTCFPQQWKVAVISLRLNSVGSQTTQ